MNITYDKTADAKYITLNKEEGNVVVAKTEKLNDWLLLDFSDDGKVIGIEILNASRNWGSFAPLAERLIPGKLVTA